MLYYSQFDRMRAYSSLFSRRVVQDILRYEDFSLINNIVYNMDESWTIDNTATYLHYFYYLYSELLKNYRCEYIFKNEVINRILLPKMAHRETIVMNEFRVDQSIADLVMFNGTSRAFEIKTDYDSDKRLAHQLRDYCKLFELCYLVVSDDSCEKYIHVIPENVGVITMKYVRGKLVHHIVKEAVQDSTIDVHTLMRSVRTNEYKNITKRVCGKLPNVSEFDMFDACEQLLLCADNSQVNKAFIAEIKKRVSNMNSLQNADSAFRQLCLSTNMDIATYTQLTSKLNIPIQK